MTALRRLCAGWRDETGLTLVEVGIASVLLLGVALGTLPLFVRAIGDNANGKETSELTNFARSKIEEYSQLDFNATELLLLTGTDLVVDEYYDEATRQWLPGAVPTGSNELFTRQSTVRQFPAQALFDGALTDDEALDAAVSSEFVHFKEVSVTVTSARQLAMLGPGAQITLRLVKVQ
jgi:type II secretory pathway pseudopilin PulG